MSPQNSPNASILDHELARAFSLAADGALDSLRVLRESICYYVEEERARGIPLDVVVANVSTMLERVRLQTAASGKAGSAPTPAQRDLAKQVVAWCVETYLPKKAQKKT